MSVAPLATPDASTVAAAVAAVERAMAELRRGGIVVLRDSQGHVALVAAAEAISGAKGLP